MKLNISLFFGFLSLQISLQVSSRENEGSLGNIEFSCPAGQYFNGGYCFSIVDVPMIWRDADRTCKRQGQYLFWVLDVDELKAVDHLAKSTWEYYWSGLSRRESWLTANEALWSNVNKTLPVEEFVWEDDQPDTGYGDCVHIKKDGYGTFDNCLRKLPFVCKAEAVLKGYFRCRSGEGIQSKFVCDGHNDCQDMSDEANCASRCHHVINAEYGSEDAKPSGEIVNTNNYLNSRSCIWSIVTNVGSIIKVQVKLFNIEKNADIMELRTGGREGEIFLAELTGTVNNQPVYYSSDNVFNIRLVTDSTVIQSGGFRISWTTDVAEVFNDVQMLTATSSVQHLKSSLYDTGYLLKEKVFEWKITASMKNIITLEFLNMDIGTDAKLYLWDQDDISLTPTIEGVSSFTSKYYISKSRSIRLMLISGKGEAQFPKGIYIKYWEGCSIHDMATEGTIQSPGYIVGGYPENIECTWTMQRPTSETRTMALRFNKFDIQSQGDYLKIYNDTSEALHTGERFTGTADLTNNFEVRSTNGYIKLVFTTNYVLTDKGFEAEFSLDCQKFAVSPETHFISKSKYETTFGNIVDFSCDEGYSFVNEGHSNKISISCQKGGEWNTPRIPYCIDTYCPIPPAVDNGYIFVSTGVKVGNTLTYQCNDGFTINGQQVIRCLPDGSWEVAPRCTASRCFSLSKPVNGDIKKLVGDGREFASVVQYVCDPGYETYGNVTTYCQTGGKWSHGPPTCEKINCPMPKVQRGNLSSTDTLKFDDLTTLTCDSGFGINGTDIQKQVLKCESHGRLSPYVACLAVCPVGFISSDGLPTCTPCPEDHYWVNTTYCEPCPNSCSTAGKNAITDITGCKDASCEMIRQQNKAGRDSQWGEAARVISIEACEQYCFLNRNCDSIHYESNTCFIYYQPTLLDDKDGAVFSKKQCSNTILISCKNDIDDCTGMCTGPYVDPNSKLCKDLLNDYQCICKAGYTGKTCNDEINECLQLYPCEHGGTCTDKVADFQCSCREGWTGKRCETSIEYCAPSPCLNGGVCFNLMDGYFCRCPSGSTGVTCGNSPEVCSIINPCTVMGTCKDKEGTAQCNCTGEYAGTSCQLIKDHCSDPDMCNNGGQCVTKPFGFECECGDSYSGSTCSMYTDPCSSNPCHDQAKCLSNKDKYMCYCEQGNVLTDNGCKDINTVEENFDIFMDRYIDGMPAYLKNPFVSHANDSMTIMFWIRVLARPGENPVLVSLEKIPIGTIIPTFNTSIQQLIVRGQSAILRGSTKTDYIQYGTDVADGKWHFMVFSLEPSGKVKLFIDSIKKTEYDRMSGILNFNQYVSWQVIFGSTDTLGRISKLRIYKTFFHDIDIYKTKDNTSHLPSDQLIQGWTNIKLTWSTFKKVPSGAGNDNVCDINFPNCLDDDRTKPSISCPDDQIKIGTKRLTAFTGLKNSYNKNEDVQYVNTSVHYDELYAYGSSNEVFIGYDEALNYGICRFKVYVKYADCPRPETNADISFCPNSKHICELNCPTGEGLCIKHKLKYRCGVLGVYNFAHPRKKLILPTCGGQQNQTTDLTVRLTYKTVINCIPTFLSNIKIGLEAKLKTDLPNIWPMGARMTWCGSQCKWDAVCRGTSTYIDVTFTLSQLSASIERNGKTYEIRDALFIFILQENGINFNNVADAQLEKDSVAIDVSSSCPAGYMVVREHCVECGKGTYRNDTTMSCEFCTIGSYQPNVGQTVCTSCQTTKTTLTYGSDSSVDCIDDCEPGQYYDIGNSICAQCERHHYQDMSGQEFCYSCPLGMKTSQKGSNSSKSCYKDCDAGTELQSDGSCKVCERGFYMTQEDDQCKRCVDGMTTEREKSASASDCKIKICYAGNFRNATTNECQECPVGWYQSEKLKDECDACPDSYTTDAVGKTHRDNCTWSVPNNSDSGKISADMANTGLIIGVSIGLVLLLCIVISVVIVYKRWKTDSDYSVPIDKNRNQVQSHEHHYDEMTNRSQQYLNVGSIPHSHGLSNNGYENADDNYATITETLSGNSSSNNDYFELYEKPTETENI